MMSAELTTEPETLRAARQYHSLGWSVVPVQPGGKLPAVKWVTFQEFPADLQQIHHWFATGGYGVGLIQGAASGTIVLDFDGEIGHETRARLEAEFGELPHTIEALTPGGGCHVFLRHPGRHVHTRKAVCPGMDVRGDGGFVVASPSVHANHRRYEWDCDHHPEETSVADCPAWVTQLICDEATGASNPSAVVHTLHAGPLGLPQAVVADGRETYMRDTVLAVLAGQCRALHRVPSEQELFDEVWPQYSRKVDFSRPGRGQTEVRAKCRYTLARLSKGLLPKIVVPAPDAPSHDPETGEILPALVATPFDPAKFDTLEPRKWVYGHFLIRRFLSVMGAPGGAGKTAYAMAVGCAVALNLPLVGEPVHEAGPVWIYNLEDPEDEILRRLQAIVVHHQINPRDLVGRLYLDSGRDRPLIIAVKADNGAVVALPVVKELILELRRRSIKLLIVDPFVKSHRLEENRNEQVDFAATLWNQVAAEADCSILLLHHFRKGGTSGDADAFRGASALVDAARSAVSLSTMTEREADKLGIEDTDRRFHVRVDNAKLNLAPPPDHAVWIKLNNIELPNGDRVQAVSRWEPPSMWEGVPMATVVRILDIIGAGKAGEQFTLRNTSADKSRWAGQVIMDEIGQTEGQAKAMLATWVKSGLIQETKYHSTSQRRDRNGCIIDLAKVAEMRQAVEPHTDD